MSRKPGYPPVIENRAETQAIATTLSGSDDSRGTMKGLIRAAMRSESSQRNR